MTIFDSVRMKCRTLLEAVNELFAMGGELEQKVDNQEEELVGVQSAMGDIQTGFSEVREEMGVLTDRVDTVEQTYDPEQLNTIKGDITAIEGDIQLLTAGVNGTQSRMDDVEESNAQAVATVQQLSQTVSGYDTEIANLKTTDTNTMQQVLTQGVRIDNEITARESGDTALRQVLETEVQTRSEQVNTLTTNLNDEVNARTNADTTLQGNIDTLDAGVVKLTGNQTINGSKIFNERLRLDGGFEWMSADSTERLPVIFRNYGGVGRLGILLNNETSKAIFSFNTLGDLNIKMGYDGCKALASTPADASNNSDEVATTQWVNTASSVVHTTGAETIAGVKTFTNIPYVLMSTPCYRMTNSANPSTQALTGYKNFGELATFYSDDIRIGRVAFHGFTDGSRWTSIETNNLVNGELVTADMRLYMTADGTKYATAPATRTTGYGTTDIATAGWVDAKIQALEARITALEGGA